MNSYTPLALVVVVESATQALPFVVAAQVLLLTVVSIVPLLLTHPHRVTEAFGITGSVRSIAQPLWFLSLQRVPRISPFPCSVTVMLLVPSVARRPSAYLTFFVSYAVCAT